MRKPKLIISQCLNSEKCRYDGQGYDDKVVSLLRDYVDIQSVCPEKGIGLKVPREPIRIEKHKDDYKLVQLKTNMDYTASIKSKLYELLNSKRNKESKIEACKSAFEEYKQKLTEEEVVFFEELVRKYNEDKIPFSSLLVALQIYAIRFRDTNLLNQTFFAPYPENLLSVTDSGKGRKM